MGQLLSSITVDEDLQKELLTQTYLEAYQSALNEASKIEQQLRVAGSSSDNSLSVPITNVYGKTIEARASNKALGAGDLIKDVFDGVSDMFNGEITTGASKLLTSFASKFFGEFQGRQSSKTAMHLVMVGRVMTRLDSYLYTSYIKTSKSEIFVNVTVVYRSVVNVSKLSTETFLSGYQYQFANVQNYSLFVAYAKLCQCLMSIQTINADGTYRTPEELTTCANEVLAMMKTVSQFEKDYNIVNDKLIPPEDPQPSVNNTPSNYRATAERKTLFLSSKRSSDNDANGPGLYRSLPLSAFSYEESQKIKEDMVASLIHTIPPIPVKQDKSGQSSFDQAEREEIDNITNLLVKRISTAELKDKNGLIVLAEGDRKDIDDYTSLLIRRIYAANAKLKKNGENGNGVVNGGTASNGNPEIPPSNGNPVVPPSNGNSVVPLSNGNFVAPRIVNSPPTR
jgi:hypothetical protein